MIGKIVTAENRAWQPDGGLDRGGGRAWRPSLSPARVGPLSREFQRDPQQRCGGRRLEARGCCVWMFRDDVRSQHTQDAYCGQAHFRRRGLSAVGVGRLSVFDSPTAPTSRVVHIVLGWLGRPVVRRTEIHRLPRLPRLPRICEVIDVRRLGSACREHVVHCVTPNG